MSNLASPAPLLLSLALAVLADYALSSLLGLPFMVSLIEAFAFSLRLLCICAGVWALKYAWVEGAEFLNLYVDDDGVRRAALARLAKVVNDPKRHVAAAAVANSIYYAIVLSYVLPVLGWSPAHPVVNSLWAGVVGVGAYVATSGALLLRDISPHLRRAISARVDPYHPDGYGGLRGLSTLALKFFLLVTLLLGLLVGAVPYAVNFTALLTILIAGNAFALSLLTYGLYTLHAALSGFKRKELDRLSKELSELRARLGERLSAKSVSLQIDYVAKELYYARVSALKTWPVKLSDILGILSAAANFLPLLLRFVA